ncbi:MAG: M14 family metallocarboxypeptidase [Verrucomicrobia bacterium]|nr:M14 family metallocarboxypeptidase [Verrucomicrobiota bacterium]
MLHVRAHDYPFLVNRWKRAAAAAGLKMREFAESGGYPIYFLESAPSAAEQPSLYISAGIHGDEAASTEGLIAWAEKSPRLLRKFRALIFPCLNPWGLVNNCRLDPSGRDLNRCYNNPRVPQIRAQVKVLGRSRFDLALQLHEDFDAHGVYIYEIAGKRPFWAGDLLKAGTRNLPPDSRTSIEGRAAKNGIVRRKITPDLMPNWPEAFLIHFRHAARTFTIETPSEFAIDARVATQEAILTAALNKCLAESR